MKKLDFAFGRVLCFLFNLSVVKKKLVKATSQHFILSNTELLLQNIKNNCRGVWRGGKNCKAL